MVRRISVLAVAAGLGLAALGAEIICGSRPGSAYRAEPASILPVSLRTNCVMWLTFNQNDGTNYYAVAGTNHGVGLSAPAWENAGGVRSAVFSGTNYIEIPAGLGQLLGSANATVAAWVHLATNLTKGCFAHIGSKITSGGSTAGYSFGVGSTTMDDDGNNLILLYDAVRWINTATAIGTGWHHCVMSLDGSGRAMAYIDGVQCYTEGSGTAPKANTTQSYIGIDGLGSGSTLQRGLTGKIGGVACFTRQLASNEVYQLFQRGNQ